jgi:hypothetical protein
MGDDEESRLPKYDPEWVACAVLEEVVNLHPTHLTLSEWTQRLASDPEDGREVVTIADALGGLRRSCLVRRRKDDVVEPTLAALRACELMSGAKVERISPRD